MQQCLTISGGDTVTLKIHQLDSIVCVHHVSGPLECGYSRKLPFVGSNVLIKSKLDHAPPWFLVCSNFPPFFIKAVQIPRHATLPGISTRQMARVCPGDVQVSN